MQFLSSNRRVAGGALGALALAAAVGALATQTGSASAGTEKASAAAGTTVAPAWTQPNADLQGTRDVASTINASNVSKLGVQWSVPLTGKASSFGNYATTPVVVGGVAYTQDLDSNVLAVNVNTGKLLWEKKYNSPNVGPDGVSVVNGVVYGATASNAFALQASTGEQLWSKKLTRNKGEGIDMAPAVNNGTVYVSTVPGNDAGFYTGNGQAILWAMNAKTGATKWKFDEVPASLWGNKKVNSGGGQWQPPTFDAAGNIYLEVANPAPFLGDKSYSGAKTYAWGESRPGKNLYTDSVIKLNPANGKMDWYYQLTPHDILDWDLNNQALITTIGGKEAIISGGKAGILIANNAKTGALLWKTPLQSRLNGLSDRIQLLAYEQKYSKLPKLPIHVRPGELGGIETPYASDGSTVYVPMNDVTYNINSQAKGTLENVLKAGGAMYAINQATGKVKWRHMFAHSPYGAATVTNNLVFTTTFDGTIWALNKATGKTVWHMKLPAGTNAPLAITGDTVVMGVGYPSGKGQVAQFFELKLGATGQFLSASSSGGSSGKIDLAAGKSQFETTCSACHTLSEAGTHGTVGPNLDKLKPSDALVTKQVTNGGGGMPAFGSTFSKAKIADIAAYVSKVAGTGNDTLGGKTTKKGGGTP